MKCEEEVLGVNVRIGVWVSSELIARYYLCLVGIAGIICVFLRIAILIFWGLTGILFYVVFEDCQVLFGFGEEVLWRVLIV